MASYVTIAVDEGITYTFYLAPSFVGPSLNKGEGVTSMAIPGNLRAMTFDSRSQSRTINIKFTLMSLYAYDSSPGKGTILDQIADLELVADSTGKLCTISVPYPEALTHSLVKEGSAWDEFAVDAQFAPSSEIRKFFCTVSALNIDYDVGGQVRQRGVITFKEVDPLGFFALV